MSGIQVEHDHEPLYRMVRASYADPLDASFSRVKVDNRWNPPDGFAALYACCSERVARAVALDLYQYAGIVLEDLQPAARPHLAEVGWSGRVIDVASVEGVAAAGFPPSYPTGIDYSQTQPKALEWHAAGSEGVVCRGASIDRLGLSDWTGPHPSWGEVAIFVENAATSPRLIRRRTDLEWFHVVDAAQPELG